MNKEDYLRANSWKERKEILHKIAQAGNWELLEEILPPQRLSDFYLKYHDDYYTSKNPHKVSTSDSPYLTQYQEDTRERREFDFSDLSMNQLKEIEKKDVNIEDYIEEIE